MSLTNQINEDLKNAMKSKDEDALRALRAIKSALLLAKTEKGGTDEVGDQAGVKILQKLAKQRKESIDIYKQQNRPELASTEEKELAIIEKYLPKQMSEEEIRSAISTIISGNGLQGTANMGKVMQLATQQLGGQADGKTISAIARQLLSQ